MPISQVTVSMSTAIALLLDCFTVAVQREIENPKIQKAIETAHLRENMNP